jgi:hypothetical protein
MEKAKIVQEPTFAERFIEALRYYLPTILVAVSVLAVCGKSS